MPAGLIQLGVIGRAHGVRGLVRVTSHTADPTALAAYGPLRDDRGRQFTLRWKGDGIAEVAELIGGAFVRVADRTAAEKLTNTRLFISRDALPPVEEEEFYLTDLIGLRAEDAGGAVLGRIAIVHDYGAGASLEIERRDAPPLILPFTRTCVPEVDVAAGRVVVAPPEEIALAKDPAGITSPDGSEAPAPADNGHAREHAA